MSSIISGEGVALDVAPAGLGSRILAGGLDLLIQGFALAVLSIAGGVVAASDEALGQAFLIAVVIAILLGYPVLCEWLWQGKTIGKSAMGLRVVRNDGGPVGFRQALVRGICGGLLEKPGIMCVLPIGIFVMLFSEYNRRIGDHLAGTFVVNERAGMRATMNTVPQFWVPPTLVPWAQSLDLTRLDDHLALGLRQFVTRAHAMSDAARYELGENFRTQVEAVIAPPPPGGLPTPLFLTTILAERRRRTEQTFQPFQFPQNQVGQPPSPYGYMPPGQGPWNGR
jgi:uncharacterized RDD family membrane protein YckC